MMNLTAQMLVCNEEKWIKFAILSALPFVAKLLIYDTGSKDKTVEIIKSIDNSRIVFEEKGKVNVQQMVALRNELLEKTDTPWFMILDGDEVYPKRIFNKINLNEKNHGVFLRNHMCVGDVFHSLPERYGKYELCGRKGHLNLRFYRKMKGWQWHGIYPLEYYADKNGHAINNMCEKLQFVDDYYWHMSFLERSSVGSRNHIKFHLGEKINDKLPDVFDHETLKHMSISYLIRSLFETPIRYLKNTI